MSEDDQQAGEDPLTTPLGRAYAVPPQMCATNRHPINRP